MNDSVEEQDQSPAPGGAPQDLASGRAVGGELRRPGSGCRTAPWRRGAAAMGVEAARSVEAHPGPSGAGGNGCRRWDGRGHPSRPVTPKPTALCQARLLLRPRVPDVSVVAANPRVAGCALCRCHHLPFYLFIFALVPFLWVDSIPPYGYTTFCLSTHELMDIGVVSTLGLL